MKKIFSFFLFLEFCLSSLFSQNKPNIIFIMIDDMGYFDLSSYQGGLATYEIPKEGENNYDTLMNEVEKVYSVEMV